MSQWNNNHFFCWLRYGHKGLDVFLENIGDLAIKPTHVFEPCLDDLTVTDGTQQSMQKLLPNQCFTKYKQNIYPMTYLKGGQYGKSLWAVFTPMLVWNNGCHSFPAKQLQIASTQTIAATYRYTHLQLQTQRPSLVQDLLVLGDEGVACLGMFQSFLAMSLHLLGSHLPVGVDVGQHLHLLPQGTLLSS